MLEKVHLTLNQNNLLITLIAHTDAIISIDVLDSNNDIILTSSDDKTIRLWDLRKNSSIKRYIDPEFKDKEMANIRFSKDGNKIFQACGNSIYQFDLRTDKILVNNNEKSILSNNDEINHIQVDEENKYIVACDDL